MAFAWPSPRRRAAPTSKPCCASTWVTAGPPGSAPSSAARTCSARSPIPRPSSRPCRRWASARSRPLPSRTRRAAWRRRVPPIARSSSLAASTLHRPRSRAPSPSGRVCTRAKAGALRRVLARRGRALARLTASVWPTSPTGSRNATRSATTPSQASQPAPRIPPTSCPLNDFPGEPHGPRLTAPSARPRRRIRLRRARLQRQQPRTGPRHHGGGAGNAVTGDPAGLGRRAQVRRRALPAPSGAGGGGNAPRHPDRAAPGPRRLAGGVPAVDPLGLHQRNDGRLLARRREDARELRLQRRGHAQGLRDGALDRRLGRRRARLPGLARNRRGRRGGRRGRRRQAHARHDAHQPRGGQGLRRPHRRRCAGDCHRHQPRRLQVQPQTHRRHPGHRPRQGDPRAHSQHPSRDARLVQRAAGAAGHHQPVRRPDEGDLRRAGRGDPARHQERRAQDQHRHRHPAGDDRGDAPGVRRAAERVRPAQGAAGGEEGRARRGQGALRGLRLRRPGCAHQAAAARGHVGPVCLKRVSAPACAVTATPRSSPPSARPVPTRTRSTGCSPLVSMSFA
mmetsp:Transcript_38701/g.90545  ORF Transcript_38701/g.90545 Transcript_38701/m.90545 type:complete len:565 (-) Transcript_38701:433-2127(-)